MRIEAWIGSQEGASFRIKPPGAEVERVEGFRRVELDLEQGDRFAVAVARGTPKRMRLLVFEVDEATPSERFEFAPFWVEGPIKIAERFNNERAAVAAWKAFAG